jgi:membrane fusion protein (multidrug efflux system)
MHLTKRSYLIISSIVVVVVAIFILKLVFGGGAKRPFARPVVVVGSLKKGEVERSETLTGDIMPMQQASIFAKVSGNLEKNFVDIGYHVTTNQILALIDTTIYVQNAKQANANYLQAEANCKNSKLNYERNKKLLEQKLIAQQDFDNAKAQYDVALAQQEAARAAEDNALTQLGYCRIISPFPGTITKRYFDPGSYVSTANPQSSTLFILMNLDRLKITINVPERSVPFLSSVQNVIVTADALPDKQFNAKISKISDAIDLATRTMAVEIEIDNPEHLLKPGMFATVQMVMEKRPNTNIISNEVVQTDDKGDYVFLVNSDSTVTKRYIKLGIKMDVKYEVLSGISETDKIVIVGQDLIKDKMKVKIAK